MIESAVVNQAVGALRALAVGLAAGTAALAVDLLLVRWTTGFPLWVGARYLLVYWTAGLLMAALIATAATLRGSPVGDLRLFALSLALSYAAPLAERAHHSMAGQVTPIAALAVVLALSGYLAWIAVLARTSGSTTVATLFASLAGASALAINRSLIDQAISPTAVGVNVGLMMGSSALAVLLGRSLGRTPRMTRAGILGLGLAGALGGLLMWFSLAAARGIAAEQSSTSSTVSSVSAAASGGTATSATSPAGGSNLVLIVVDTLRADVFANVLETTDEGRAFRARMQPAVRMRGAIAVSPWTIPSTASLLTGLYPEEHGFVAPEGLGRSGPLQSLHPSVETMAETLGRRGYRTEAVVTNPSLHPVSGIARGFERYALLAGPTVKLPLATALSRLGVLQRVYYQDAAAVRRHLRRAVDKIREDPRPFFLWLHLMDPHAPLLSHRLPPEPGEMDLDELDLQYRREVRYCLRELALTLDQLESHGLLADTAVVLTSDHGEMFPSDRHRGGTPRSYGHGHALYDELVRVPLLIRQPRLLDSELTSVRLVSQVDLYGSLPALLGIDPFSAPDAERRRIAELLSTRGDRESDPQGRRYALSGSVREGPQQRSLRTPRYKLIESAEGARPIELYDLAIDPRELRNLGGQRPRVVQALQQLLREAVAAHRPPPSEIEPADRRLLEQLKTLGYVE